MYTPGTSGRSSIQGTAPKYQITAIILQSKSTIPKGTNGTNEWARMIVELVCVNENNQSQGSEIQNHTQTASKLSRTIHRQLANYQGIAVGRKEPACTIPMDTTHTVHAVRLRKALQNIVGMPNSTYVTGHSTRTTNGPTCNIYLEPFQVIQEPQQPSGRNSAGLTKHTVSTSQLMRSFRTGRIDLIKNIIELIVRWSVVIRIVH